MNFIFEHIARNYGIQSQAGFNSGQGRAIKAIVQLINKFNYQEYQREARRA
jgi:hypothetical protein